MQDIVLQDDDKSSMAEDTKLSQDRKYFKQLRVGILVIVKFFAKKALKVMLQKSPIITDMES